MKKINGREVEILDLQFDNYDRSCPVVMDAYFLDTGEPLTEDELDFLGMHYNFFEEYQNKW